MAGYEYLRNTETFAPLNYTYAPYGGDGFLDAFNEARTDVIDSLTQYLKLHAWSEYYGMETGKKAEFIVFDHILNGPRNILTISDGLIRDMRDEPAVDRLLTAYRAYLMKLTSIMAGMDTCQLTDVSVERDGGFTTGEVLKLILLEQADATLAHVLEAKEIVRELTKKYEIFQMVFTAYNASYKKISDDFRNIADYALLSIAAASVFEKAGNYRYLNALLKINDLFSCKSFSPSGLNEALFVKAALDKEAAIIKRLRKNRECFK